MFSPEILAVHPSNILARPPVIPLVLLSRGQRNIPVPPGIFKISTFRFEMLGGTVIHRARGGMEAAWLNLSSTFLTKVPNNLLRLGALQRPLCPALSLASADDQINELSQIFNFNPAQTAALMLSVCGGASVPSPRDFG